MELSFRLAGIFTGSQRTLHGLNVDGLSLNIRNSEGVAAPSPPTFWSILEKLQADNFRFSGMQLQVENGNTNVEVQDGVLTGSELEAGILTARQVTIASPWFHKTLTNLRGATSWQENRLALGAISLMPGFDIDTITIDLSQIGNSRIGMQVNLDAFGGKSAPAFPVTTAEAAAPGTSPATVPGFLLPKCQTPSSGRVARADRSTRASSLFAAR